MRLPRLPIKPCIALPALLLAGCGTSHGYPSLAQRPVERITLAVPPAPPAPPAPAPMPSDLQGKAAALLDAVRAAHATFATLDARLKTGTGGADTALGQLEAARGVTSSRVADVEALYTADRVAHAAEDGAAGEGAPLRPAAVLLAAVRAQALALLAEEDAALAKRMAPSN
ncbi:MAG: hypothetical protein JSS36_07165 [Proteobacteria bacterium]|nr:hypothetical protein [Pseudomonadota bacterium]